MQDATADRALDAALSGLDFPEHIRTTLALVTVSHVTFEGEERAGQLIVHRDLASEVADIFAELRALGFPIEKIIPIAAYGWNDEASMTDNNSSAFNYRRIYGTDDLSNHSFGRAVDVNPIQNPYIARDGSCHPPLAVHDLGAPGTFFEGSSATQAFLSRGWEWGGRWPDRKDWQHFQKLG